MSRHAKVTGHKVIVRLVVVPQLLGLAGKLGRLHFETAADLARRGAFITATEGLFYRCPAFDPYSPPAQKSQLLPSCS